MKKDSFGTFMALHVGYIIGYMIVIAFTVVAIDSKIPAAIWTGVILLTVMGLATCFGYKKWKRNQ